MVRKNDVVISGLGVVSPLGEGIGEYWKNILKSRFFLKKISIFSVKEFKSKYAFQIQDTNFAKYFKQYKSEYITRSTKFLLVAAKKALEDSRLTENLYYKKEDVGIFTATIYGSWRANYDFYGNILVNGPDNINPMSFPPVLINYPSNYLSIVNGFKGPNLTFSSGFHAGLEAAHCACSLINQGFIKASLVSGLNDLCLENYAHFFLKGLLYEPKGKGLVTSGIFERGKRGVILGENASVIILENAKDAQKRKANIYAKILGYSSNFGMNVKAYSGVIKEAIIKSGLMADDIDLCMLNTNGLNEVDALEIESLRRIFKNNLEKITFVALKENNGECEAADGVLQIMSGAKILDGASMPYCTFRLDKGGKMRRCVSTNRGTHNILINSFNPEGINAALIIAKA